MSNGPISTEDETHLLDAVDRWLERDVRDKVMALERADEYPHEMVAQMRELGLFGATIPAEYGGLGLPAGTYSKIVTRISEVWMSLTGIFNSHLIMSKAVERFGTDAQKKRFLPRFASGEIRGGLALTEPNCGTDLQAIRTTADRQGDNFTINGTKTWISNGIEGGCFAVLVKTDPQARPRHRGMSLFLAEKGNGLSVGRKLGKIGYKGIDSAELVFENYQVPVDNLIGGEQGQGFYQTVGGLELGRINVAARGVGIANAALKEATSYSQVRGDDGQADLRAPGDPDQAGGHGHALPGSQVADRVRSVRLRPRGTLRHGGRNGQALRLRSRAGECPGVHADPRRLRLLDGVSGGAALPGRTAPVHRRGHQRDATDYHRPATRCQEPGMTLPLEGLRIVAAEHWAAGPYATGYLADLGADVIKIENASQGGDACRTLGPYFLGEEDSHVFQSFNRNKRSLTLDLKHPDGRAVLHRLIATADAFMHNLRGDQATKLGLTYGDLAASNPRIVCAHISAYGREGERNDWPGFDYLMQAEAGFFSLTGEPESPPTRFGLSMIDYMTGATTSTAILAGILGARESGKGRDIDVTLFDVAMYQLTYPGAWYLNEDFVTRRVPRSSHPYAVPSQLYRTRDGWIMVMAQNQRFWGCSATSSNAVISRPIRDSRIRTGATRTATP